MTSFFDKLNLAPAERRLVVIVAIVIFVVLNFWLVIPQFGEWAKNEQRTKDAKAKLQSYQTEIAKKPAYEKELKELESQGGYVATEEAALRLSQEVNSQAALSGVTITAITPLQQQGSGGKTNAFFQETAVTVNINSSEKELIEFLFRLADKDMLIRARSMQLTPDPSRMRLQGPIRLVKSFQRKPPVKAASSATPAAAKTATPAPATTPVTKPDTTAVTKPKPVIPAPTPAPAPVTTNSARRAPSPVKP